MNLISKFRLSRFCGFSERNTKLKTTLRRLIPDEKCIIEISKIVLSYSYDINEVYGNDNKKT